MTIINIRGTSGSGKSTLVHKLLQQCASEPIEATFDHWKKPKTVAYKVTTSLTISNPKTGLLAIPNHTYVIGRYETQCGGCDSMSYKGSHDDIEALVREFLEKGNVIFEGLTISSTLTRWRRISDEHPGEFVWAFMDTPEEVCYQRILARSGREPKRDNHGLADYQRKYRGCMRHVEQLRTQCQRVEILSSDDAGYQKMLELLNA